MYPVAISTERLSLREFCPDDVDEVLAIYGDAKVAEHMSFEPRNREQVEATITGVIEAAHAEPRDEYSLAGVLPDDSVVGYARLAIDRQHPAQSSG